MKINKILTSALAVTAITILATSCNMEDRQKREQRHEERKEEKIEQKAEKANEVIQEEVKPDVTKPAGS